MMADQGGANPLSYLHTYGPAGDPVTVLGWGLGAVAVAVTVIVAAALIYAIWRRRAPQATDAQGRLPVTRAPGGMRIVYVGVGVSVLVLFGCAVWTLTTLAAVVRPDATALTLDVIGHQWWWELQYRDDTPSQGFATANEMHVPVGRPLRLRLHADDVIHSFWVPQLAGKTDVVPGQTNEMWLQADRPGRYRGTCAEYCGAQHAHMGFVVVAETPEAFEQWRRQQRASAASPSAPSAAQANRGAALFAQHCAACHAVRGTEAGGSVGPDLTHVMSRTTLAAAAIANTPAQLRRWIDDAPALKPNTQMPPMHLADGDLAAVTAYVATLK